VLRVVTDLFAAGSPALPAGTINYAVTGSGEIMMWKALNAKDPAELWLSKVDEEQRWIAYKAMVTPLPEGSGYKARYDAIGTTEPVEVAGADEARHPLRTHGLDHNQGDTDTMKAGMRLPHTHRRTRRHTRQLHPRHRRTEEAPGNTAATAATTRVPTAELLAAPEDR
jgi:hypothetical protein